jgi:hypothetical protein
VPSAHRLRSLQVQSFSGQLLPPQKTMTHEVCSLQIPQLPIASSTATRTRSGLEAVAIVEDTGSDGVKNIALRYRQLE